MVSTFFTRVTVVELKGYREWTESLGEDREWLIQSSQASLYRELQKVSSSRGGFVLPMRYDYMLVLSSNLCEEDHREIWEAARQNAQVKVRMASTCARSPLEAELRAWTALKTLKEDFIFEFCEGEESSVISHLDVNYITTSTREEGVTRTYHSMLNLVGRLSDIAEPRGGIIQYLGGDNVLAVLPGEGYLGVTITLMKEANIKAGLGVARKARDALALAARALHEIRRERKVSLVAYVNI
ncbi:MAG: GTP cyclohydrolase IIa [Acidilobaceae archaeon]